MANDTTNPRFWVLDTAGVIAAVGVPVCVRKIAFYPTTAADDLEIQEYDASGTLRACETMKAAPSVLAPLINDFGDNGRVFNGFKLSVIDHGFICVYIGRG